MALTATIRMEAYKLNGSQIRNAYLHNMRLKEVPNAHEDRTHLNYDLVTERKDDYESYVKQKLRYIRYLCNEKRAIRKDAVGSIELVVRANGIFLDVKFCWYSL